MNENILFTICARSGSKGVKGKNIQLFNGKPLLYYTLEAYEKFIDKYSSEFQKITLALNTDSDILHEQMEKYGLKYVFIPRKEDLAGDVIGKRDVIRDTLCETEKAVKISYDIVVDLDLTSPLRTEEDIKGTIDLIQNNEKCNYAYSVVESRRSPYFNMVCQNKEGYYERVIKTEYTCRQQVPKCYDMNASIYAMEREFLLNSEEQQRALIWIMEDTGVLDIDSERDFELMQFVQKYVWRKN